LVKIGLRTRGAVHVRPVEVVNPSGLTDADWSEINKLRQAFEAGGEEAPEKALDKLAQDDPIRHFVIISAMFPEMAREALKDQVMQRAIFPADLLAARSGYLGWRPLWAV
jgi:hypothetical protein